MHVLSFRRNYSIVRMRERGCSTRCLPCLHQAFEAGGTSSVLLLLLLDDFVGGALPALLSFGGVDKEGGVRGVWRDCTAVVVADEWD